MSSRRSGCGCLGWTLVAAAAVALCLLATFLWILPSQRKSYTIEALRIKDTVLSDGTLVTAERFSYAFDGRFTRVYRDIPWDGHPVTVTGVDGPEGPLRRLPSGWTPASGPPAAVSPASDPTPSPWTSLAPEERPAGYYRVTGAYEPGLGSVTRIEAFADLRDRTADFTFRWQAEGAAERWADAGELEWQLVGDAWGVPIGRVRAVVTLPPGASRENVRAWGHGPLNGVVRVRDDGSVTLAVDDLPPETYVEVHALFPPDLLSGAEPIPIAIVPSRVATERVLAERADELRDQAAAQAAGERRDRAIAWAVAWTATIAALVVWFAIYVRWGREHRPRFRVRYLREVPADMPPALVGALWRMGRTADADLAATLLDLAVHGVVRLEPDAGPTSASGRTEASGEGGEDAASAPPAPGFRMTLRSAGPPDVDELTAPLVTFLFDEVALDDSLTLSEMQEWAKEHPGRFRGGVGRWRRGVEDRARERGFVEKGGGRHMKRAALAAGGAAALAWIAFVWSGDWWLAVPAVACVVLTALSPVMGRRSREAAELYAQYRALYRYLRDFGRLHEKPPTAVVLWEEYLVMAVVFGIADEVLARMQVHVPEVLDAVSHRDAFWFAAPATAASFGGAAGALTSFTGGLSAAVIAASPPSSRGGHGGGSSAGGGRGFSGGGGRGGGGGGGGAD